jgi:hypothetical protein
MWKNKLNSIGYSNRCVLLNTSLLISKKRHPRIMTFSSYIKSGGTAYSTIQMQSNTLSGPQIKPSPKPYVSMAKRNALAQQQQQPIIRSPVITASDKFMAACLIKKVALDKLCNRYALTRRVALNPYPAMRLFTTLATIKEVCSPLGSMNTLVDSNSSSTSDVVTLTSTHSLLLRTRTPPKSKSVSRCSSTPSKPMTNTTLLPGLKSTTPASTKLPKSCNTSKSVVTRFPLIPLTCAQ